MTNIYRGGVNSSTYKCLFDEGRINDKYNTEINRDIFHTIDINNLSSIFERTKNIILCKTFGGINVNLNKIKYNSVTENYEYELEDNKILRFRKLSDYLDDLNDISKKELLSLKRHGNCHCRSLMLCSSNKKSKLLSGICALRDKAFYHSVLLLEDGNIADWTRDLVMRKEDYESLTNFEVLSSIDGNDINELIKINELFPQMDLRMYLYFRDELIDDLTRHKLLRK